MNLFPSTPSTNEMLCSPWVVCAPKEQTREARTFAPIADGRSASEALADERAWRTAIELSDLDRAGLIY